MIREDLPIQRIGKDVYLVHLKRRVGTIGLLRPSIIYKSVIFYWTTKQCIDCGYTKPFITELNSQEVRQFIHWHDYVMCPPPSTGLELTLAKMAEQDRKAGITRLRLEVKEQQERIKGQMMLSKSIQEEVAKLKKAHEERVYANQIVLGDLKRYEEHLRDLEADLRKAEGEF
jgi:hypothetical protein